VPRPPKKATVEFDPQTLPGARQAPFPSTFIPMLASLADTKFSKSGWIYEPKMDGIRGIALIRNGQCKLLSRRGLDLTSQYPVLARELPTLVDHDVVLDGEIIALNEAGRPSFQHLQQRMNLTRDADVLKAEDRVPVYFFVFDILQYDQTSLTPVVLAHRKAALVAALRTSDRVKILNYFDCDGKIAYQASIENGFEGIVAKRVDSVYESGRRSPSWLKVKAQQTADFVIGGYTPGEGSRSPFFGALLLGYFDADGKLIYSGSVGTGFNDKLLYETMRRMGPLAQPKCPFKVKPADKRDALWISPEIACEIKFMDWTRDGHLRNPVFMRFRDDKGASEVTKQDAVNPFDDSYLFSTQAVLKVAETGKESYTIASIDATNNLSPNIQVLPAQTVLSASAANIISQLADTHRVSELLIEGEKFAVTHMSKPLWPKDAEGRVITKRDYMRYLAQLSPYLLPFLHGRPLTLIRSPNGVMGKKFYQKHWNFSLPEFVETIRLVDPEDESGVEEHLVCNNLVTLLFLAQHGVLELHTFPSRIDLGNDVDAAQLEESNPLPRPQGTISGALQNLLSYPDYIIFDLDQHTQDHKTGKAPINADAFKRAAEVGFILKEMLESVGLVPFVKTSGRNGLHIFVPIVRNVDFDIVRALAETMLGYVLAAHHNKVTVEMNISKRADRVFLDAGSNGRGKTCVTAYSPRATIEATLSMPLSWNELSSATPQQFTMHNAAERLQKKGDAWHNIFAEKRDLQALLARRPK
jgi:bifunctional non-homologous end joining protein LigD